MSLTNRCGAFACVIPVCHCNSVKLNWKSLKNLHEIESGFQTHFLGEFADWMRPQWLSRCNRFLKQSALANATSFGTFQIAFWSLHKCLVELFVCGKRDSSRLTQKVNQQLLPMDIWQSPLPSPSPGQTLDKTNYSHFTCVLFCYFLLCFASFSITQIKIIVAIMANWRKIIVIGCGSNPHHMSSPVQFSLVKSFCGCRNYYFRFFISFHCFYGLFLSFFLLLVVFRLVLN